MDERDDVRLTDYGQAFRRWWPTIVVAALIGAVVGAVLISPQSSTDAADVEIDVIAELDLTNVMEAPPADRIGAELVGKLDRLTAGMDTDVSVSVEPDSQTIRLNATGATAEADLTTVAETYVAQRRETARTGFEKSAAFFETQVGPLQDRVDEIEEKLGDIAETGGDTLSLQTQLVQVLNELTIQQQQLARNQFLAVNSNGNVADPVLVETMPDSSSRMLGAIFGSIIGGLLGVAIVVVRTHLDRRVRTARQLERLVRPPVLEVLPVGASPEALGSFSAAVKRATALDSDPSITVVGVGETGLVAADRVATGLRTAWGDGVDVPFADASGGDVPSAGAVIAMESGMVDELELSQCVDTLHMRGTQVRGVVLMDVPRGEFAWAYDRGPSRMPSS